MSHNKSPINKRAKKEPSLPFILLTTVDNIKVKVVISSLEKFTPQGFELLPPLSRFPVYCANHSTLEGNSIK